MNEVTATQNHIDECYDGDWLAYFEFWNGRRYWGFGPWIPFVRWRKEQREYYKMK